MLSMEYFDTISGMRIEIEIDSSASYFVVRTFLLNGHQEHKTQFEDRDEAILDFIQNITRMNQQLISTTLLVKLLKYASHTVTCEVRFDLSIKHRNLSFSHVISGDGSQIFDVGIDGEETEYTYEEFSSLYGETQWTVNEVVLI